MRIEKSCEDCLYKKQVRIAQNIEDEAKRNEYIARVREILDNRNENDCSPYMVSLFRKLQSEYGIPGGIFPKEKYNSLLLGLEERIEKEIEKSRDPLCTAILFSRIGNYIDFGAMNTVDDDILIKLLNEAGNTELDEKVYVDFVSQCSLGSEFLLITDNCGEIVLDKLMLRQLKKRFPNLSVKVMVRGSDVLNDATMEDAIQSGITQEATVITNGTAIAGTVYEYLPKEAREAFDSADIIVSKGQGNYESIQGSPKKVFYLFLCKCDLFINRFNVPKLTGMFIYS